jgi:signal transduction histidine kinase
MNHFEFPRISSELAESLVESLLQGKSVVILGGRNVGKRYLLRRIYKGLTNRGRDVGVAAFLDREEEDGPGASHPRFLQGIPCLAPSQREVAAWWRAHSRPGGPPANLLVANFDAQPSYQALRLIAEIKQVGWGGVLITCEAQGGERLCEAKPIIEFDRAVVVSGLAREEFETFARRYLDQIQARTSDSAALIQKLFERTGGNMYFLRALLWAAFDRWAAEEGDEAPQIDLDSLPDQAVVAYVPWNHYLRYVTRLIGHRPELWDRLEQLVRNKWVPADPGTPDLLELTGIPVREGDRLVLPGRVVGEFLERHYTARKFADLYAGQGDWDRAFEWLRKLPAPQRVRPATVDDVADTTYMVKRLATSLHQEAAVSSKAVRARFADGCRLLLGFSEVSFWMRGPQQAAAWVPVDEAGPEVPPPAEVAPLFGCVPVPGSQIPTELPIHGQDQLRCMASTIPSDHPDRQVIVIVRDADDDGPWSQARMELLRELFGEFIGAYDHALKDERFRARAQFRHDLGEVVLAILTQLGPDVRSVDEAVRRAADDLRSKLNYNRVLVSLLDPKWERIRGYYEASDDPDKKMRQSTDYQLDADPADPAARSIHVAAVRECRSLLVPDAAHDDRANPEAVSYTALRAGAVILLDTCRVTRDGKPVYLGTLFVERRDGLPPDAEEFEDLRLFGRKLAGLIEQSERIQLLQSTLDEQREPLAIHDAGGRLRYANHPATERLVDPPHGWRNPEDAPVIALDRDEADGDTLRDRTHALARLAYQHRMRFVEYVRPAAAATNGARNSWIVLADVIEDEALRKRLDLDPTRPRADDQRDRLGVFLEGQDYSFLQRILDAFTALLNPDTLYPGLDPKCPESGLNPTDRLIDEIGRVFTTVLGYSSAYYDALEDEKLEGGWLIRQRQYNATGVVTGPFPTRYRADGMPSWCLKKGAPVVFYYDKESRYPDGTPGATSLGLRGTAVRNPVGAPDGLAADRLWIDFPLFAGERPLGKMALNCDEQFPPEDFELLKMSLTLLRGVVGTVLELAQRYGNAYDQLDRLREEAAREGVANFIHNLRRPIKSVSMILSRYRSLAPDRPELFAVHEDLEDSLRRFTHYAKVAGETQSIRQVRLCRTDLRTLIEKTLQFVAPRKSYTLTVRPGDNGTAPDTTVDLDEEHVGLALSELVENSRKYCPAESLRIGVVLGVCPRRDWICLEYTDNGPGIRAEDKPQLFDRGFVIPRPGVELGTGLGLHYVSKVVQLHGGRVREDGEEGQGVRFVIEFPRSRPAAE